MTPSSKCIYAVLLTSLVSGTLLAANAADAPQAQSEALPPATTTVLPHTESVLGKTLIGAAGEKAGRIVDNRDPRA